MRTGAGRSMLTSSSEGRTPRCLLEAEALDRDAVHAVIEAAGLRPMGRPSGPFGLTRRELEVLRLLVLRSWPRLGASTQVEWRQIHSPSAAGVGVTSLDLRATG